MLYPPTHQDTPPPPSAPQAPAMLPTHEHSRTVSSTPSTSPLRLSIRDPAFVFSKCAIISQSNQLSAVPVRAIKTKWSCRSPEPSAVILTLARVSEGVCAGNSTAAETALLPTSREAKCWLVLQDFLSGGEG